MSKTNAEALDAANRDVKVQGVVPRTEGAVKGRWKGNIETLHGNPHLRVGNGVFPIDYWL